MPARCSAEKVRHQMARIGLTTPKLIAKSHLSESTIRRILADKEYSTSDYSLQQLSEALQCSPYDLLRDSAIDQMTRKETEYAVEGVVAEAVMEAVTVVTESVAPETSPKKVAESVPVIPVATPPTLDIPSYVEYIKESTSAHINSLKQSRNAWRNTSVILFVLLLLAIFYFAWEIFNPDKGITRILWEIYISSTPPAFPHATPSPTITSMM